MTNASRGAALLDEIKPNWFELIDLATLDIDDPNRCVLGQVFSQEAEDTGLTTGFSYYEREAPMNVFFSDHGFLHNTDYPDWVYEVDRRRLALVGV